MEIPGEPGMVETKNKNREKRGKSLENKNIWAYKKKACQNICEKRAVTAKPKR